MIKIELQGMLLGLNGHLGYIKYVKTRPSELNSRQVEFNCVNRNRVRVI